MSVGPYRIVAAEVGAVGSFSRHQQAIGWEVPTGRGTSLKGILGAPGARSAVALEMTLFLVPVVLFEST
jgi:hypothetical protein